MSRPIIKINCDIDEDYINLLDNCIELGKKLVDKAIDKSISAIEEEEFRKLVREEASKLFGEVVKDMETVRDTLGTIEHSSSVVVYDIEETDYGFKYLKDIRFIDEIKQVVEDKKELKSDLEKFLDINEWLEIDYDGKYIDEDGEEKDIYWKYCDKLSVDSDLGDLLKRLLEESSRFYVH